MIIVMYIIPIENSFYPVFLFCRNPFRFGKPVLFYLLLFSSSSSCFRFSAAWGSPAATAF